MQNEPDRVRMLAAQLTQAQATIEALLTKVEKLQTAVALICGKMGIDLTELKALHAMRRGKRSPAPIRPG